MSTSAHTPGPWTIRESSDDMGLAPEIWAVRDGVDQVLALIAEHPTSAEEEANARLIAAAPRYDSNTRDLVYFADALANNDSETWRRMEPYLGRVIAEARVILRDVEGGTV